MLHYAMLNTHSSNVFKQLCI